MIASSVSALIFRTMRARLPGGRRRRDAPDLLDQPVAQVERRDEDLAEALRPAEAGEVVEEIGDVRGDVLVGREEAEVLVEPRRPGVVVPRSDVDVAPQHVALAANDQRRLRVDLQVVEPVDDVHARLLEGPRPLDVQPLVEACLELDEADALLARLGGLDQRGNDRRVLARPVHRRLDPDRVGVDDGRSYERLDRRRERVVWEMDEDVALADLVEELARRLRRHSAAGA